MHNVSTCSIRTQGQREQVELKKRMCFSGEFCKPTAFPCQRGKLNKNKFMSNLVQESLVSLPMAVPWLSRTMVPRGSYKASDGPVMLK